MIYCQISFEKYVPNHLISSLYSFYFIFRYRCHLSNYPSWKSFVCLKWILKNLSTTLHTQFNYPTLPACPFNFSVSQPGVKLVDFFPQFVSECLILSWNLILWDFFSLFYFPRGTFKLISLSHSDFPQKISNDC